MPKRIAIALAALLAGASLLILVWMAVAGPATVLRVLRYGDTQIDDFEHYPLRALHASADPAPFTRIEDGVSVPESVSLDGAVSQGLDELLETNDSIAFLVVKGDVLLAERYYQGHTPSSYSMAFSVSKSIIATLIGAAIQDGLIESVDQPITAFVPELSANGFDGVKLWHLLTMRSGSNYVENDNPFGEHVIFNYTPDLESEILKLEAELPPAMEWRYKSGDNALLALALSRALMPRTLTDYTQEKLWNPLGAEYGGGWSLDDEGGLERSWCCLAATARDFAKLGRLYLNNGEWNGKRILPDNWVELSTQIDGVPPEYWDPDFAAIGVRSYGYQWWLLSEDQGDFMAFGKDGQFIYINPSAQLIIVRLGWSMGEMRLSDWVKLFQTVAEETG